MPTDKLDAQLTPRIFFNKVLAGTASGTIIALIPNAVLGANRCHHMRDVQV